MGPHDKSTSKPVPSKTVGERPSMSEVGASGQSRRLRSKGHLHGDDCLPTAEERDLRQLLIHRHKLVEIRTRVKNGLQHLALFRGVQKTGERSHPESEILAPPSREARVARACCRNSIPVSVRATLRVLLL